MSPAKGGGGGASRAVTFHGLEHARAAAEAATGLGVPLTLVTAPGAAAYAGAEWFQAVVVELGRQYPDLVIEAWLDCRDRAGDAMGAMRAGVHRIIFTGDAELAGKLRGMAGATGMTVADRRPFAFDPRTSSDMVRDCRRWLSGEPDPAPGADR